MEQVNVSMESFSASQEVATGTQEEVDNIRDELKERSPTVFMDNSGKRALRIQL